MSAPMHEIVLRREGEGRIAIVKCSSYSMTSDLVMTAIVKAVTKWVEDTDYGKDAWCNSSEDFNIADLSVHISDTTSPDFLSLLPFLIEEDILNLEIELYGVDDMSIYTYDTVLVEGL